MAARKTSNTGNQKKWYFAGNNKVVGLPYHQQWEAKVDGFLAEGAVLALKREPGNVHDAAAIAVYAGNKQREYKIGYIPKDNNLLLAAVMDLGLRAAVRVFSVHENYIVVRVYLGK